MENYSVYGELRCVVSKDFQEEGEQEAIERAYEFLNDSSNIVSVILVDMDGKEIKFDVLDDKSKLSSMDIDWEEAYGENE